MSKHAAAPMQTEPALTIGIGTAGVAAILGVGIAFGLPVSDEQQSAILVCVAAVPPLIVGAAAWIRSQVYAPATVDAQVEKLAVVKADQIIDKQIEDELRGDTTT